MVRAVRVNQWVVHGGRINGEELDRVVEETFENNARCQFELYHHLQNPLAASNRVRFAPEVIEAIESHMKEIPGNGAMVVGVHMSNFDFLIHFLGRQGLRAQALSTPNPGGGYRLQNYLRNMVGIELTPITKGALRKAQKRLEGGGIVLTGIDRPIRDTRYLPRFFGNPAALPVLHIPLAIKTGVPVYIVSALMDNSGVYTILLSDPIFLTPHPNRHLEIISNAEKVLAVAEKFILRAPTQWSMTYPVWPEAAAEMDRIDGDQKHVSQAREN